MITTGLTDDDDDLPGSLPRRCEEEEDDDGDDGVCEMRSVVASISNGFTVV